MANNKEVRVQVGRIVYKLVPVIEIQNADHLMELLQIYDMRLLSDTKGV
jgi:hypothetical protein